MSINIIIFSKDRPMQLELFIRSFNKYVKDYNKYIINILYTYSNDNFKSGYNKLINMDYTNVNFIRESNFKPDLIKLVDESVDFTVFFVDDIVFKNNFNFYDNQMGVFKNDNEILCRSLRLHPNLTYCYPMELKITKHPNFLENNIFYWKDGQGAYGYPMSVDGNIFRTREILPFVRRLDYRNPNSFEGVMAVNNLSIPKMICYNKSIIVNNPCNIVQINNSNVHGNVDINELNNKFLDDYIISLNNFDGIENTSCHQEIEINFENTADKKGSKFDFEGVHVGQTPNIKKIFKKILPEFNRIIEIGTDVGGLSLFLYKNKNGRCDLVSYDIDKSFNRVSDSYGIDFRIGDCFSNDTHNEIKQLILDESRRTLLLCDGGDKNREFNLFSQYLKKDDVIMCHDYSESETDFLIMKNNVGWEHTSESHLSSIQWAIDENNLSGFHYDEFKSVIWGAFKK